MLTSKKLTLDTLLSHNSHGSKIQGLIRWDLIPTFIREELFRIGWVFHPIGSLEFCPWVWFFTSFVLLF